MNTFIISVFTPLLMVCCATINSGRASAPNLTQAGDSAAAEREIRAGFCDFQRKDYAAAQRHFAKALELDPARRDAPFLIASMLKRRFKPGDNSPVNIELARQAIAAFDKIAEDPAGDEWFKREADGYILDLYGRISEDGLRRVLLARAEATDVPKERRSRALTILASKQWNCSYEITEREENKEPIQKTEKEVVVRYKKPADQADFEKARQCAAEGLRLAEQATALDPNNQSAWPYKANLLREMSKLAGMGGDADQKAQFDRRYEEALDKVDALIKEAYKNRAAEEAAREGAAKTGDDLRPDPEMLRVISTEANYFKLEPKVANLVERMAGGWEMPVEDSGRKEIEADAKVKRVWKQLAPRGEDFSALMPSPVKQTPTLGLMVYESASDGVRYTVFSHERSLPPDAYPAGKPGAVEPLVLHMLTHATVPVLFGPLSPEGGLATSEVKLLRKAAVGGHQSTQYAFTVSNCDKVVPGILNYYFGKTRNYVVLIYGVDENDPRARRFLQSLRLS